MCFPVNFVKFRRTPFSQNTSGRLLLPFPYSHISKKLKFIKKKKIAITLMQGLSKAFVDEDLLKELYLEVIFSFYELFISAIYLH